MAQQPAAFQDLVQGTPAQIFLALEEHFWLSTIVGLYCMALQSGDNRYHGIIYLEYGWVSCQAQDGALSSS